MSIITSKNLQCEFGLSFVAAASIIHEQRKLALKRYWPLNTLNLCLVFAVIGLAFIDRPGVISPAERWLWPILFLLAFLQLYVVHRASHEPILAAARARSLKPLP